MPNTLATLNGRRALITGSTGGLGLAMARALAEAGCDIMLNGLEPEAEIAGKLADLRSTATGKIAYCQADLSQERGVAALMDCAMQTLGGVEILVNNAVVRHFAPIETFDVARWDAALAVNLSAAFHTVRLSLPGMRAAGWGRIINMSSIYASRATRNRIDYVTTKTALLGFTRAVAIETLEDGITCNAVCPGAVHTPASEQRIRDAMARDGAARDIAERDFLVGKQPSGRFIEADDVAALIVYLCGPHARDITGAVLPIDGGWLAS
jgi:3-hydroxybutyrate dehydrogenase